MTATNDSKSKVAYVADIFNGSPYETWIHLMTKLSDIFLVNMYQMAESKVKGTENVLIVDEQIPGQPKLFVQPIAFLETMQSAIGTLPVPFVTAAKQKRTGNFPVFYNTIRSVDMNHSQRVSCPVLLPFLTPQSIAITQRPLLVLPENHRTGKELFAADELAKILSALQSSPALCKSISSANPESVGQFMNNVLQQPLSSAASTTASSASATTNTTSAPAKAAATAAVTAATAPVTSNDSGIVLTASNLRLLWERSCRSLLQMKQLIG